MLRSCDSRSLSLKAEGPASATIPPATAAAAVAPAPTATPAAADADAAAATVSPAPTATPAAAASGGHDKGELVGTLMHRILANMYMDTYMRFETSPLHLYSEIYVPMYDNAATRVFS